jgi:hypothetical protein
MTTKAELLWTQAMLVLVTFYAIGITAGTIAGFGWL